MRVLFHVIADDTLDLGCHVFKDVVVFVDLAFVNDLLGLAVQAELGQTV